MQNETPVLQLPSDNINILKSKKMTPKKELTENPIDTTSSINKIRLQKYMANMGIASRRKSETFITQGLVKVNGKIVTEQGLKIDPDIDIVEFDNLEIKKVTDNYVYLMVNKPKNYITSLKQTDSSSPLVVDLIKNSKKDYGRIYPVGRLDKDSSGLILLTNDGNFAYKLTHPSFNKEKEYEVTTERQITNSNIVKFEKGVTIDGVKTAPAKVSLINNFKVSITLTEGRNRQIRKMIQKVGNSVKNLQRVRINRLRIGELKLGEFRELTGEEVRDLMM